MTKAPIDLEKLKAFVELGNKGEITNVGYIYASVPDLIKMIEEAYEIMNDCLKSDENAFPEIPEGDIKEWQGRLKKEGDK